MPIAIGTLVASRYRVEALIGQGGMGSVYRAFDERSGKRLAIKELSLSGDEEEDEKYRGLFRREIKALMLLDDPGVVRLVDHGESEDGLPFVVTELLDGVDLDEAQEMFGALPAEVVAAVGLRALQALAAAQQLGIVHRDIKPANLYLCRTGRVVVLDFGLARGMLQNVSHTLARGLNTQVMGTPHFLPPERLVHDTLNLKGDLYSLGASLFTLLSNAFAFEGETTLEIVNAVARHQRRDLAALAPHAPPALVKAILELAAFDPDARPDIAVAVATFEALGSAHDAVLLQFAKAVMPPTIEIDTNAAEHSAPNALTTQATQMATLPQARVTAAATTPMQREPHASRKPLVIAAALGLSFIGAATWAGLHFRQESVPDTAGEEIVTTQIGATGPLSAVAVPAVAAPAPAASQPALPTPVPVPVAVQPAIVPSPAKAVTHQITVKADGTLNCSLTQWAEVSIDGTAYGRKQVVANFTLTAGHHEIEFSNSRYGTRKQSVLIRPGQPTHLTLDFTQ